MMPRTIKFHKTDYRNWVSSKLINETYTDSNNENARAEINPDQWDKDITV